MCASRVWTLIQMASFLQNIASPTAGLGVGIRVHQLVVAIHKVGEFLGFPNAPHFRHRDDTHTVTLHMDELFVRKLSQMGVQKPL